jgi:hypothetical protein
LGQPAPFDKKYALLIGVNAYDNANFTNLYYAERDVAELAKILTAQRYEVVLLSGTEGKRDASRRPTRENILKHIDIVLDKCKRQDMILFAFAGHGVQFKEDPKDKETPSFFCPMDAQPNNVKTMIPLKTVYQRMEDCGAAVKLMLVDACRVEVNKERFRNLDGNDVPAPPKGVSVLFGCKAGQAALESNELKHGLFFYHVLEGLRGKATNARGDVTWQRLASHAAEAVLESGYRQVPVLRGEIEGAPVLLRVDASRPPTTTPKPMSVPSSEHGKLILALKTPKDASKTWVGRITSLSTEGVVKAREKDSTGGRLGLGAQLAVVVHRDGDEPAPLLVKGQVTEVDEDIVYFKTTADAVRSLARGSDIAFFLTLDWNDEQRRAIPDVVRFELNRTRELALHETAANRLKNIGRALLNYEAAHRALPPGVIYGPDGKPWHSWRTLILPFLDQQQLFNEYRFDEPWDGPNNIKLLPRMPREYLDPFDTDKMSVKTSILAAVGSAAGFTRATMEKANQPIGAIRSKGRRLAEISDGTSNTILAGSVAPEDAVEWTRPREVQVGAGEMELNAKGSFAAMHKLFGVKQALFLFADGSVQRLPESLPKATLTKLLTVNDGQPISLSSGNESAFGGEIRIYQGKDEVLALWGESPAK